VGFPGGVCIRGMYRSFRRSASMVFWAKYPHVPTAGECKALTEAYGLWESNGFIIPLGYALLRSADSHFVGSRAASCDPAGGGSYVDGPFDRPGFIPSGVSAHLPTTLAPLVYWEHTPEKPQPGRTYCLGLTEQMNRFTGDTEVINDLYGDALLTQMQELRGFFALAGGAVQVGVERMRGGVRLPVWNTYPVTGAHLGDRLMGSQRRRTRPDNRYL
jgi:hypothetical protein